MSLILKLRGSAAFSASRLARLQADVGASLVAEHWYFVETDGKLNEEELVRLKDLLGIPVNLPAAPGGTLILVTPRLGTISPWASKATDIAHNCGFAAIKRIERGVAYHVKGGEKSVLAGRLHDRMTESVLDSIDAAEQLFHHVAPQPLTSVDILAGGRAALVKANGELGLALVRGRDRLSGRELHARSAAIPTDVELMMFAQANSEHCRHKIFNASWDCRWRATAAVAVRHDPRVAQGAPGRHGGGLLGQRLGDRRGANQALLPAGGRKLPLTSRTRRTSSPRSKPTTIRPPFHPSPARPPARAARFATRARPGAAPSPRPASAASRFPT